MKVTLNKIFPMNGSVDSGWKCLQDIETVASCMPGAEITEKTDEENFKGKVKVKLGPVVMAFDGDIQVKNIDEEEKKIHLIASGTDNKGTSNATMDLTALIKASESEGCQLIGDADVTVNGKMANFGARMMTQVADQILGQFADNFSNKLDVIENSNNDDSTDVTESVESDDSSSTQVSSQQVEVDNTTNEINGFKIAWSVMIGFVKSFFTKSK